MKWVVQVSGKSTVLDELCEVLDDKNLKIESSKGSYFLTSSNFVNLTSPEIVSEAAQNLLEQISGSVRQLTGQNADLKVAHIARERPDGTSSVTTHLVDKVNVSNTEKVEIRRNGKLVHKSGTYNGVVNDLQAAKGDEAVTRVLRLLRHKQDWVSLYHVYEIIEQDVGGIDQIANRGWASKTRIKRFKQAANSPAATGEHSRHGKESGGPPRQAVDLNEATGLIQSIITEWIREKV